MQDGDVQQALIVVSFPFADLNSLQSVSKSQHLAVYVQFVAYLTQVFFVLSGME